MYVGTIFHPCRQAIQFAGCVVEASEIKRPRQTHQAHRTHVAYIACTRVMIHFGAIDLFSRDVRARTCGTLDGVAARIGLYIRVKNGSSLVFGNVR